MSGKALETADDLVRGYFEESLVDHIDLPFIVGGVRGRMGITDDKAVRAQTLAIVRRLIGGGLRPGEMQKE